MHSVTTNVRSRTTLLPLSCLNSGTLLFSFFSTKIIIRFILLEWLIELESMKIYNELIIKLYIVSCGEFAVSTWIWKPYLANYLINMSDKVGVS